MGTAVDLAKHTQALVRRFPLVADALLALVLAAAAFVSLAVTYSGIPVTDHAFSHGFTFAVIASTLALTLPLAWRRRQEFCRDNGITQIEVPALGRKLKANDLKE